MSRAKPVSGNPDYRPRQERVDLLTDALVSGHLRLYRNSAEFHQGVDLLARSLVRFVDLMAEDAERAEAHRRAMIDMLNRGETNAQDQE